MSSVRSISEAQWQAFVAAHPLGNILQTASWGRLKSGFGWGWQLLPVLRGESLIGGALILYKPLPLRLGAIAYVPRGPLVAWTDPLNVSEVLDAVQRAARRHRSWALWMEPEAYDTPEQRAVLQQHGFQPAPRTVQPPRTVLVDIAGSEGEILEAMKSKTRYNIRLAERRGVQVREGGAADFSTFSALMQQTGKRDGFGTHTEAYYRRAWELFAPSGQAALLLAELEGQPVAGLMVFALGSKSWYLFGASSDEHRSAMPTYAIQWQAIRWAKARGCTTYDLWGIPDVDEATLEAEFADRHDGLWGVYRFKRGFGGQVVRYVGMVEKSLSPLYPLAMRLRHLRGAGRGPAELS